MTEALDEDSGKTRGAELRETLWKTFSLGCLGEPPATPDEFVDKDHLERNSPKPTIGSTTGLCSAFAELAEAVG